MVFQIIPRPGIVKTITFDFLLPFHLSFKWRTTPAVIQLALDHCTEKCLSAGSFQFCSLSSILSTFLDLYVVVLRGIPQ